MLHTGVMAGGSGQGHEHPIPPSHPVAGTAGSAVDLVHPIPIPASSFEWQQREEGWFALVAHLIEADRVLVQQWLSADSLTRVG